jgi:hypothetical protein
MNQWRNILKAASGFWGVIPGIAVMIGGLYAPENSKVFFGACVETFGVLSVIVLYGLRRFFKPWKLSKKLWAIGICSFLFFSNLLTYSQLYSYTHITYKYSGKEYTSYVALWPTPKLKKMIKKEGTREAVGRKYGPGAFEEYTTGAAQSRTTFILLIAYLLIFTPVPIAFGFATTMIEPEKEKSPPSEENDDSPGQPTE